MRLHDRTVSRVSHCVADAIEANRRVPVLVPGRTMAVSVLWFGVQIARMSPLAVVAVHARVVVVGRIFRQPVPGSQQQGQIVTFTGDYAHFYAGDFLKETSPGKDVGYFSPGRLSDFEKRAASR